MEIKNTFTEDELLGLLTVNVQPSREGLITDKDLEQLMVERGEGGAFEAGGAGFRDGGLVHIIICIG